MPVYEYECEHCLHAFEEYQKLDDKPLKRCPRCKKHKLIKIISLTARPVIPEDPRQAFINARMEGKKMAKEILGGNEQVIADVYGEDALSDKPKKPVPKPKTLDEVKNVKGNVVKRRNK